MRLKKTKAFVQTAHGLSRWPDKKESPTDAHPLERVFDQVRLSNSQLKVITDTHLKEISNHIEDTYQRRIDRIREHAQEAQSVPIHAPGPLPPEQEQLDLERRMGHLDALTNEHNNILISQEISNYRLRRLHHQR